MGLKNTKNALAHAGAKDLTLWILKFAKKIVKKRPQLLKKSAEMTKPVSKMSGTNIKNAQLDASPVASPLTARQRAIKKLPLPSKTAKRVTKNATRRSKICIKNAPCPVKRTKF